MLHLKSFLVVALAISGLAAPPPISPKNDLKFDIFESLEEPPKGWQKDDHQNVDKDMTFITLRIHLKHQNMDKFHDLATKIATPGHEMYGRYLEQHVIDAMIAPKKDSQDLVFDWLASQGFEKNAKLSQRSEAIVVEATVADVESLLDTKYSVFVRSDGERILRTLEYSLPRSVKDHVEMVQPTTFFGLKSFKSTVQPATEAIFSSNAASAVTGCSGSTINPACLSNLYNYASDTTNATVGRMGIAGFLEEYAIPSDLTTFMSRYATQNNKAEKFTCTIVNGGSCPTSGTPGVEANLDVQYARAITEHVPNVYYSTGGRGQWVGSGTNTNEPYIEFLNYMLALPDASLPNTLSISYGDDEQTVPLSYATNACNLFSQLGARGVSVLVASGDSGVGTTCTLSGARKFTTSFPAGCPWVTTVGGTTGNSPEGAWSGGGGGFSEVFGRPSYQNATVNNWLATDTTHSSVTAYFNSSGRAYPDVSAQATNFVITVSGSDTGVSGTSCATPTFASIIQLVNSDRIASGKKGLGFLNPWLYSSAVSGLTDITKGKIGGCSGVISGAGFSAVTGWDPATGLGTPNYAKLLAISRAT